MGEDVFRLQFTPPVMERLRQVAHLDDPLVISDFDTPEVRARLADCEVLLTSWGCPPIAREVLDAAPQLRAIIHAAGSVRAQVPPAPFDPGLLVPTAAAVNAVPVAEYTLAMILACGKRVPFLARDARTHRSDWSYLEGY